MRSVMQLEALIYRLKSGESRLRHMFGTGEHAPKPGCSKVLSSLQKALP